MKEKNIRNIALALMLAPAPVLAHAQQTATVTGVIEQVNPGVVTLKGQRALFLNRSTRITLWGGKAGRWSDLHVGDEVRLQTRGRAVVWIETTTQRKTQDEHPVPSAPTLPTLATEAAAIRPVGRLVVDGRLASGLTPNSSIDCFMPSWSGRLVACIAQGRAFVVDAETGKCLLTAPDTQATRLAFAPDDGKLYVGGSGGEVIVYGTGEWRRIDSFGYGGGNISGIAPRSDGSVALLDSNRRLRLFDEHGKKTFEASIPEVKAVASRDGSRVALYDRASVRVVRIEGAVTAVRTIVPTPEEIKRGVVVEAYAISPDGTFAAAALVGPDKRAEVETLEVAQGKRTRIKFGAPVSDLAIGDDGKAWVAGRDGIWTVGLTSGRRPTMHIAGQPAPIEPPTTDSRPYFHQELQAGSARNLNVCSVPGLLFATTRAAGEYKGDLMSGAPDLLKWVRTDELSWDMPSEGAATTRFVVRPDNSILIPGKSYPPLLGHRFKPTAMMSGDGRVLASLSEDVLKTWNLDTGEKMGEFGLSVRNPDAVSTVLGGRSIEALSYDGSLVAFLASQMEDVLHWEFGIFDTRTMKFLKKVSGDDWVKFIPSQKPDAIEWISHGRRWSFQAGRNEPTEEGDAQNRSFEPEGDYEVERRLDDDDGHATLTFQLKPLKEGLRERSIRLLVAGGMDGNIYVLSKDRRLAALVGDQEIAVCDMEAGAVIGRFPVEPDLMMRLEPDHMAFSSDGRSLLVKARNNGPTYVWTLNLSTP